MRNGMHALGQLKTTLTSGFVRAIWSFDELLATLMPKLPEGERALAYKLAGAILDESKVEFLDDEPIWRAVEAPAVASLMELKPVLRNF